jgi:hypothetical protein
MVLACIAVYTGSGSNGSEISNSPPHIFDRQSRQYPEGNIADAADRKDENGQAEISSRLNRNRYSICLRFPQIKKPIQKQNLKDPEKYLSACRKAIRSFPIRVVEYFLNCIDPSINDALNALL